MNMPAMKTEAAVALPATTAKVLPMSAPKRPALASRIATHAGEVAVRVVPPIVVIALALIVWELLCRKAGATLPPPSKVLNDTWELITNPFFDRGGLDKGLFWHLSASLQRVALGYALASIAGVALGTLVGQSVWAMRGLDPIFQVLRTVPPLAWLPLSLAAFRQGQPSAIFVIFITGLRIGIGLSWLAIVAAEMLIGGVGIGFFIWDAWNSSHISEIILALIYVGLIGFILDRMVAGMATIVTRGTAAN